MSTRGKSRAEKTTGRYRRVKINAPTTLDDRVYCQISDASYDLLIEVFLRELCKSPPKLEQHQSVVEEAWCRFVFAAIALGGMAGPNGLSEILQMRFEHLVTAVNGYVSVPRASGLVPVFIPSTVAVCALSLCVHLMRGRGGGRNRIGPFPTDGYLLPHMEDPRTAPAPDELKTQRRRFQHWLTRLCSTAGIKVTIGQLALLARGRLAQIYSPPVTGALLGFHLYNPAPIEQYGALEAYRRPLDWHRVCRARNSEQKISHCPRAILSQADKASEEIAESRESKATGELPETLVQLRRIVVVYSREEKKRARSIRKKVRQILQRFTQDMRERAGRQNNETWSGILARTCAESLTFERIEALNAGILAEWLNAMMRRSPPNTVEARLNDLMTLAGQIPDQLLFQMDEQSIIQLLPKLSLSRNSQDRWADSLRSLYHFSQDKLNLPVPRISWWRLRGKRTIRQQRLLTQHDLERLLIELGGMEHDGYIAIVGALLGYYFGLRAHEICRIRLGDIWLDGTPTVFVWNSKGDSSRSVEGIQIPARVTSFLQRFHRHRLQQERGSRLAPLLSSRGYQMTGRRFGRIVGRAMRRCGLSISSGGKRSVVHVLRHACANRWWALGMPLIEITHRLGHKSIDTTMLEYLHCAHFLQAEQLAQWEEEEHFFSTSAAAVLLGLTSRGLRYAIQHTPDVVGIKHGSQKSYSTTCVLSWLATLVSATNE